MRNPWNILFMIAGAGLALLFSISLFVKHEYWYYDYRFGTWRPTYLYIAFGMIAFVWGLVEFIRQKKQ